MPYSDKMRRMIEEAPDTLGSQLGKLAMTRDVSVTRVASATGATRQTVYNWFGGGEVTQAYRAHVQRLLAVLSTPHYSDDAWRNICRAFAIKG